MSLFKSVPSLYTNKVVSMDIGSVLGVLNVWLEMINFKFYNFNFFSQGVHLVWQSSNLTEK